MPDANEPLTTTLLRASMRHGHADVMGMPVRGCQVCEEMASAAVAKDPTAQPRKAMVVEVTEADVHHEADQACRSCRGSGKTMLGLCLCAGNNFAERHAEHVVRPDGDEEGKLYWLPGARP